VLVGGWGSKTHQADGHKTRSINGEIPSLMWWGYQTKLVHYLQQQKWVQGSHPVFRHPAFTFTQVQAMSDLQMLNNALVISSGDFPLRSTLCANGLYCNGLGKEAMQV